MALDLPDPFVENDGGCLDWFSNQFIHQNSESNNLLSAFEPRRQASPVEESHGIDTLISQAMSKLTLQEREKALNDVHGVAPTIEEDKELIGSVYFKMITYLETIKRGTAYERAELMNKQYVSNRAFVMMFLRADRYKAEEAAERMIRFFELKRSLFGEDKLVKDITLDDLDEDDLGALECGGIQLIPCPDMSGRPMIINIYSAWKYKTLENRLRASYYVYMASIENSGAQKKGIVSIYYMVQCNYTFTSSMTKNFRYDLPIHFASHHTCYSDPGKNPALVQAAFTMSLWKKPSRMVRCRMHIGSHIECQYELAAFGIPTEALPVAQDGTVIMEQHQFWIESKRQMEASKKSISPWLLGDHSENSTSMSNSYSESSHGSPMHYSLGNIDEIVPCPNDVLFGKGAAIRHPGNIQFRKWIDMNAQEYLALPRAEKFILANKILELVESAHGRFLKRNSKTGKWEEVDEWTARNKVSHSFRNHKLKLQKELND